jgi:hypothetical protein
MDHEMIRSATFFGTVSALANDDRNRVLQNSAACPVDSAAYPKGVDPMGRALQQCTGQNNIAVFGKIKSLADNWISQHVVSGRPLSQSGKFMPYHLGRGAVSPSGGRRSGILKMAGGLPAIAPYQGWVSLGRIRS